MATARKYTALEPEKEDDAAQLSCIFIGQSNADVKCQLQKLEGQILGLSMNCWRPPGKRTITESLLKGRGKGRKSVGKENCWL